MIRFFYLLPIVILFTTMCYGQQKITIPPDFIEITPSEVNSDEWSRLNSSGKAFKVTVNDGTLDIRKGGEESTCELKISNGTLYGIAGGEWGGLLIFVPFTDPKKWIEMDFANITSIFMYNNQIYIIAGIGFWGATGAMYKLNIEEGNSFKYEKVLDFDNIPLAQTIYNDKLLIVTYKNFYIVNDSKKELIFENIFRDLHPNSIAAIDERNVFVGMRGGIARLDLETRTFRFYKNDKYMNSAEQDYDDDISSELAYEIRSKMRYPMMDYANNIEGTSIYQFDTDNTGNIDNVQLISSSGSLTLDAEANRLLYEMPKQKLSKNATRKISINFKLVENKIYREEELRYQEPEFPGGRAAMLNYIHKNINFPPEAEEMGIQGRIVCGFIVEKLGTIGMVEILTPLNQFIDAEVVKTIKRMPRWMPGRKAGRLVRMYCIVTVNVGMNQNN